MYHANEWSMHGELRYMNHRENTFVNLLKHLPQRNNHQNKTKASLSFVYLATKSQCPEHSLTQFLFYEPLPAPHYYFVSQDIPLGL